MGKFVITSDTTADLYDEFFEENNVEKVAMPYLIDGVEYNIEKFLTYPEFYGALRGGSVSTTCQVSLSEAERIFESKLKQGLDILHISFSSGMSGSYENLQIVKKQLEEKYPERKL